MAELEKGDEAQPALQHRLCTPLLLKKVPPVPRDEDRPVHPKATNPFSWFFFTWLTPVLLRGYKRTLLPEDMFKLHDEMTVEHLAGKFQAIFDRRLAADKKKYLKRRRQLALKKGDSDVSARTDEDLMLEYEPLKSLCFLSLYETFLWQYSMALLFGMLGLVGQACNPLLSRKLINFVELEALGIPTKIGTGIGYAFGVAILMFVSDVLHNQGVYFAMLTGAQIRAIFTKALLDKSFKLNTRSRKKFPPSKITSIMSTDVSRVDLGTGFSIYGFVLIFPVGVSIGILIYNIKAPAMVGVGLMLAFVFVSGGLSTLLFSFRKTAQKATDSRVGYMKEVLNNLKMIKFYSWEKPYHALITKIRRREMAYLLRMEITRMIIITLAASLALVSSLVSFLTLYAIASPSSRNPAEIFSSVSLFNLLASQFLVLPLSIAGSTDAFLGMNRVAAVLAADEIDPEDADTILSERTQALLEEKKLAITVQDGEFEWELFDFDDEKSEEKEEHKDELKKKKKKELKKKVKKSAKDVSDTSSASSNEKERKSFKLHNVNLDFRQGAFVVITGSIGSGKSSLLHALDGAMKKLSGDVYVNGSLLMCGTPWIQSASLRENILFGSTYDEKWYKEVIRACSLESDFDILPAGDLTEIGERGITLSGGQKARVCLARTVYANSSIILLDDVLSAVDAKVGKHIMSECIMGILKGKTRVLATHQLSLISEAEHVIFLNGDGTISRGTFEELKLTNSAFKALMEHNRKSEENDKDELEPASEVEASEKELIKRQLTKQTTTQVSSDSVEKVELDGKLYDEEEKSVNAIGWDVYGRYILTGVQGFKFNWLLFVILCLCILGTFMSLFTNNWLSFWISRKFDQPAGFYIGFYAAFTGLAVILMVFQFCSIIFVMNRASRILNIKALGKILHVPMSFMDTTPMGRILNRFTKDTDTLDNEIGDRVGMVVNFTFEIWGVIIMCIIYMPWFAIAVPFIVAVFIIMANFYQASGREVKRLEAVQRSHVYNNFNESLTGMPTIKAFKLIQRFLNKNVATINKMDEAYFVTVANQRWLDTYLSLLATLFALLIALLCVCRVFDIGASAVGLLVSYVLQISGLISMLVVVFTQVEQNMNSAERVMDYVYKIPQERPYEISETRPPPEWPQNGEIRFINVDFAYREGLPLTLRNINADIKPHEKIGICGRTGAGKSSIMVALFRIAELTSGSIMIDGIDVSTLGLHELRSNLSIIPQDPVLFKGTIRSNLDPFETKTDDELWDTLRRADIIDAASLEHVKTQRVGDDDFHKFHLDNEVDDEGENFSLGEKQLVAFARALVRDTKIIVLDEATSSVDYATDSKLQKAIVREFSDRTILCIAHRLKTILHYDRVIVMEQGEIKEFDTPSHLYNSTGTIFRQMCDKSGISKEDFNEW